MPAPSKRPSLAERTLEAQVTRINNDIAMVEELIARHVTARDTLHTQRDAIKSEISRLRTSHAPKP